MNVWRLLQRKSQCISRRFANMSGSPVQLSYEKFDVNPGRSNIPLLILHGMSGSKESWRGIAARLNRELRPYRTVYTIDARNHGESPWTEDHTYDLMTEDVVQLYRDLGIRKAALLGHSMGGRTSLNLSLKYPELVEKLIIVDIVQFNLRHNVELSKLTWKTLYEMQFDPSWSLHEARQKASEVLSGLKVNAENTEFLLRNLKKDEEKRFKWNLNLKSLRENIENTLVFPQENLRNVKYHGPTLYIGGANSKYIYLKDVPKYKENFPQAEAVIIPDAGHLVHEDQTEKFHEIVCDFLNNPNVDSKL